jgi:hypothetical protein
MVRNFKSNPQLRINVFFRPRKGSPATGSEYLARDVPNKPFGDNCSTVSFWVDDKLMVFPMDMIDHCELYEV